MEPFFQMAKPGGAKAGSSLFLKYAKSNSLFVVLFSILKRHWLILLGVLNSLIITVCTAFASEVLYISTSGDCGIKPNATGSSNEDCIPALTLRPWLAWFLSVLIFFIFAFTIIILFLLCRRTSGIFAEATSIAGIGALYSQTLDNEFTAGSVHPSARYALTYDDRLDSRHIIRRLLSPSMSSSDIQPAKNKSKRRSIATHPVILVAIFIYLGGIIAIIAYYRFVSKPGMGNSLEDFFDSQSFGVRLFMNILGLSIKMYWGIVYTYVNSKAPYIAMTASKGATARQSILVQTASHPITALFSAVTWRNFVVLAVTVAAVLSEVLVVALGAIPYSVATAYVAFEASVYISVGILGYMILLTPMLLVWRVTKTAAGPEPPESLAETLALLQGSNLGEKLSGLGKLNRNERDKVITGWEWGYTVRNGVGNLGKSEREEEKTWRIVIQEIA
jgi:Protein of unknown function (DUF3433)